MSTRALFIGIFLPLWFMTERGFSQTDSIFLRGRFDEQSLKLRWSTASLDVLRAGFVNGYEVGVYHVQGDREILVSTLSAEIASDADIAQWLFNQTDTAAYSVVEELLEDSNFFLDEEERQWKILSLLFGLQDNFGLTKALGMGIEIEDLDRSLNYRCKIGIHTHSAPSTTENEVLDISYPTLEVLPVPESLHVVCRANRVTISGLMEHSAAYYSSFRIDRDTFVGNQFEPVNEVPLIVNYAQGAPQIYVIDTIIESRPTRYRVQGKDIWGIWGPYSDTIFVDPCHINLLAPHPFQSFEVEDRGAVEMWWSLPDSLHALLKGFEIYRSENKFEGYHKISDLIPPDQFTYRDHTPQPINYYYVEAIYSGDIRRRSLSNLSTLIDTEPPPVPGNVQVVFDTATYKATITWDEITVSDLSGYRISYNAEGEGHQKFLLYNLELDQTIYHDTINPQILQEGRFYWITARDFSGNESFYSEPVQVKLPDRFPPAPARITGVRSDFSHAEIHWVGSPSRDVARYLLQSKKQSASDWSEMMLSDDGGENTYLDSLLQPGDTTLYRIVVTDSSGLKSVSNMRSTFRLPEPFLPDIQLISMTSTDSSTVVTFDYSEAVEVKYFRLMGGPAQDSMTSLAYIEPNQAILRTNIQKQGASETFALYRHALQGTFRQPYFFKISAVGLDGRISRYSEIRQL